MNSRTAEGVHYDPQELRPEFQSGNVVETRESTKGSLRLGLPVFLQML